MLHVDPWVQSTEHAMARWRSAAALYTSSLTGHRAGRVSLPWAVCGSMEAMELAREAHHGFLDACHALLDRGPSPDDVVLPTSADGVVRLVVALGQLAMHHALDGRVARARRAVVVAWDLTWCPWLRGRDVDTHPRNVCGCVATDTRTTRPAGRVEQHRHLYGCRLRFPSR